MKLHFGYKNKGKRFLCIFAFLIIINHNVIEKRGVY